MAEQNGNTPAPWRLDLAAFSRKPAGVVILPNDKGKATEYQVWSVLDLKPAEAVQVLTLEDEIAAPGKTFKEQMDAGLQQVLLLCPGIPATVAAGLTPNELVKIRRKALGYDAANPQIAEAVTSAPSADSSASSPAQPSSSAGPGASSTS